MVKVDINDAIEQMSLHSGKGYVDYVCYVGQTTDYATELLIKKTTQNR